LPFARQIVQLNCASTRSEVNYHEYFHPLSYLYFEYVLSPVATRCAREHCPWCMSQLMTQILPPGGELVRGVMRYKIHPKYLGADLFDALFLTVAELRILLFLG